LSAATPLRPSFSSPLLIVDIIGMEVEEKMGEVEWKGEVRKGYNLNGLYTMSITRRPSSVEVATDNGQVLEGAPHHNADTEISSQWQAG
jgi:hypothetical protein